MTFTTLRPLLVGLALSCSTTPALSAAGAPPIEDLLAQEVEGASRFAQPLSEAPSAVSIVSADDIRQYGLRTLGEALQTMRGVYTTNERDYTYIGLRGFARPGDYNTRMLLMTDGIRRNDPLYDDAFIGNEAPIEMDWVKRLEFVPGPSSALYGANAIFGVANAVLWSGADLEGTRIRADAGSGGMGRVSLLSGRRTDAGNDWMVGVTAYGRHGKDVYFRQFDDPASNNGWARGLDGEHYVKGIGKFVIGDWQFDGGYSFRRKNIPTAAYGTDFNAPGTFVEDRYAYVDAAYAKALSPEWDVNLRLRAGDYDYLGQYVFSGAFNRDTGHATWYGVDYAATYSGWADHKWLIGGEVQEDRRLDQTNFDVSPRVMKLDDHRRMTTTGVFVQDEWRFAPTWIANLGARVDRIGDFGMTSPRAALIHRLSPAATLKLLYGQAFRPPNSYERYYTDGSSMNANPTLRPERITTHEIVADFAASSVTRYSASLYHYRIKDLIDQTDDPANPGATMFVNRPALRARGLELEAETVLSAGLHVRASASRQTVIQSFGDPVNSPKWLGKLLMDGPLFSTGWNIGLNLQAVDRRTTTAGIVPGYGSGSLVLTTAKGPRPFGHWSIGLYNLAGRHYLEPASSAVTGGTVPTDGRELRVGWEIGY